MSSRTESGAACPLPGGAGEGYVTLAHGGGGRLMQQLIRDVIVPALGMQPGHATVDAAVLPGQSRRLAFTTDSYVVTPLFFPGGDIGALAVNGTINDLAAAGARARWLSLALILEEGLPLAVLRRVLESAGRAAAAAGVSIVTGDTKVVSRGQCDGLYLTTTGVGALLFAEGPAPGRIRAGDALLVSGDLGRHGAAIVAARQDLGLTPGVLASDCAPLHRHVEALAAAGIDLRAARDLTRGGFASCVVELARDAGLAVMVEETALDTTGDVREVCGLLGLDPLYLPNEGRMVYVVPGDHAGPALTILAGAGARPARCGEFHAGKAGRVTLRTRFGTARVLDLLSGDQLPRIC
jgi:hydrogenase expression/formation protein HypE